MITDKKLREILIECYREAYSKATPPADYDTLDKKDGFWDGYFLPQSEHFAILDRANRKYKLCKFDRNRLSFNYHLGQSPR